MITFHTILNRRGCPKRGRSFLSEFTGFVLALSEIIGTKSIHKCNEGSERFTPRQYKFIIIQLDILSGTRDSSYENRLNEMKRSGPFYKKAFAPFII